MTLKFDNVISLTLELIQSCTNIFLHFSLLLKLTIIINNPKFKDKPKNTIKKSLTPKDDRKMTIIMKCT